MGVRIACIPVSVPYCLVSQSLCCLLCIPFLCIQVHTRPYIPHISSASHTRNPTFPLPQSRPQPRKTATRAHARRVFKLHSPRCMRLLLPSLPTPAAPRLTIHCGDPHDVLRSRASLALRLLTRSLAQVAPRRKSSQTARPSRYTFPSTYP